MVEYDGDEVAAKDVAMHVAAMKPVALSTDDVPAELIESERSVATLKAAEDADKAAPKASRCSRPRSSPSGSTVRCRSS